MKLWGIEISIRRQGSEQPEEKTESPSRELSTVVREGYKERTARGAKLKTFRKKSPVEDIVFPEPENINDPWQKQALANLVRDTHEMYMRGWFDICITTDAVRLFCIPQNGASRLAREKLRLLHCVRFEHMLPELYDQIPGLLSCVYSGGEGIPQGLYE